MRAGQYVRQTCDSQEMRARAGLAGALGARFIQREMVLSETSKPSIKSSP